MADSKENYKLNLGSERVKLLDIKTQLWVWDGSLNFHVCKGGF